MNQFVATPCDKCEVFLQKINRLFPEPPPSELKAVDDWSSFKSWAHFEMAEFIYCYTCMSAANTDKLIIMLTNLRDGKFLFKDHNDLCNTIDASDLGDVPWQHSSFRYNKELLDGQVPEWMTELYEVYYCNPCDVIMLRPFTYLRCTRYLLVSFC